MKTTEVAAIPYRRTATNELEVLVVTSRRKGRWVLPKGKVGRMMPHSAAEREAFEEAGVMGVISNVAVGIYYKRQTTPNGDANQVPVRAYPLLVKSVLQSWPEMAIRKRQWLSAAAVTRTIDDAGLSSLLVHS